MTKQEFYDYFKSLSEEQRKFLIGFWVHKDMEQRINELMFFYYDTHGLPKQFSYPIADIFYKNYCESNLDKKINDIYNSRSWN